MSAAWEQDAAAGSQPSRVNRLAVRALADMGSGCVFIGCTRRRFGSW